MEVTKIRKVTICWEQISNAINLGELHPGDRLTIADSDWKVLDIESGKALIWKCTNIENHVFNKDDSNNYEGSDIQKYLQTEFKKNIAEEMLQVITEEGFFLLTVEQIKKYMPCEIDRIATDDDGDTVWYWTASPYVGSGHHVRIILPSGYVGNISACLSRGVAPACWLNLTSRAGDAADEG